MRLEYLLGFALGEWQLARASVAHLQKLQKDGKWTLKHAFFADMGGFMLQTKDGVKFFLDTKHIYWMLKHNIVSTAQFETSFLLDPKAIDDRNKSNLLMRSIALVHALWFCIDIIVRGVQGLAVTMLEITTVGIIVDGMLVYYFCKDKPGDVESAVAIDVGMTLDETARSQPYFRTSPDSVSRDIWALNLIYHHFMDVLKGINPRLWREDREKSLKKRDENDIFLLNGVAMIIKELSIFAFMITNFIAWDFHFVTEVEKWLWRTAFCGLVAILVFGMLIIHLVYDNAEIRKMQERVRKHRGALEEACVPGEKANWRAWLRYYSQTLVMKIRNNSLDEDRNLEISLFFAIASTFLFAMYTAGRLYILIEDMIAFRAMSADAYMTVQWSAFIPHIG